MSVSNRPGREGRLKGFEVSTKAQQESTEREYEDTSSDSDLCSCNIDMADDTTKVGGCCCSIVFLTLIIMLITSFVYVEHEEYAFKKSTTTNKVDTSEVYSSGRYLWGFDKTKVVFPKLYQHEELTLSVSNQEGVAVEITVSFLYLLQRDQLASIYNAYGTNYESTLTSLSRAAVRNAAVDFGVGQFLTNRSLVRAQIANDLSVALADMNIDCPQHAVQLNDITFSESILTTHLNAAIRLEENLQKGYEQTAEEIRAETAKLVGAYEANTTIVLRTAEALKEASIETAQAKYDEIITQARGDGLDLVIDGVGIETQDKAKFLKLMAILDNPNATIVEMDGSAIINLG